MKLLAADLRAKQALYSQYGPPCSLVKAAIADGTLANALYRAQGALARWRLSPLALIVHLVNKWVNGCVIGVRASFGPGFILIHPIGVVINSATRGGRNVWVESSVVIGDNRGRSPVIGDDVFIGSGAKIIGGVQIGSGARIGANAVVLHDVAPGSTVVGIPARPLVRRVDSPSDSTAA
ncbi:MAG: DapH/DapD/GlmU-related protein [Burkholderiaceae bacterium]|jgi:serine O-acetyltransferase